MRLTKLQSLSGAAAIALLATMGTASAALVINAQGSGAPPFAVDNVGTAGAAGFVSAATILNPAFDTRISSIVFTGGTPTLSGVYAGSTGTAASPLTLGTTLSSSLREYFVAEPGGNVTINFNSAQTALNLLWGTVDIAAGYNVVTNGLQTINGATINALIGNPPSGSTNAAVEITGLNSFTSLTFSDSLPNSPAFEFALGQPVPEPASLALLGTALIGLGAIRRRRKASKAA